MASYEWLEYNGTMLVNTLRTALLARAMGVDTVRINAASLAWLDGAMPRYTGFGLGGFGEGEFGFGELVEGLDYGAITDAPWYDAGYPASSEFAGFIPLDVRGLDDSSLESATVEYITDGGHVGKARNATLPIVANFAIIAKTERGAEYGKRWLDRVLMASGPRPFCAGADLRYFRWAGADAPIVHRRNVRLTRGTSVTLKRKSTCSATWLVTFTMTAADPYEYGEPDPKIDHMGGATPTTGPGVTSSGSLVLTQVPCAEYDYSPIYDPLYPALVAPPVPPDFLPAGWTIESGDTFDRRWARISPIEPSSLNTVPVIQLHTTTEARMVRVSVWPGGSAADDQCDPLFSVVVSYLPAYVRFYIDGERKAAYVWDGYSPIVRRTDSLVYSNDADPVQWAAFNDPAGLLVTLDTFAKVGGGYEGDGNITASLALTPKSD